MADVAIPQTHLDMLKENPDGFSLGFDKLYGEGASSRVLNAEVPSVQEESQPGFQQYSPDRERTVIGKIWNNSAGAVAYGAQEAVNETIDALGEFDDWYARRTRELGIPAYLEFGYDTEGDRGFVFEFTHRPEQGTMFFGAEGEEDNLEFNVVDAPTATPGKLISGVSQFVSGFVAAGKFIKVGGFLGAMAKGMVADALVFDPKDPNVTAMVSDVAGIEPNAWTELMATDIDDPNWQNRLRNVAEGAVMGAVVDAAFYSVRALRLRRAGRVEEAEAMGKASLRASRKVERAWATSRGELADEVGKELPPIAENIKKAMDDSLAARDAAGAKPTRGDLPAPVRDPDQPDLPGLSSRDEGAPDLGVRRMTPEEISKVRERRAELDKAEPSVALKDTGITRPDARASWEEWQGYIGAMRESNKNAWTELGPQSDAQVLAKASLAIKEMAVLTGEDPAALIQRYKELPLDAADLPAEMVARGDVVRQLTNVVDTLADAIDDIMEQVAKGQPFPKDKFPLYSSVDHMRADLSHKISLLSEITGSYGKSRSSAGRTLRALRLASENAEKFKKYMEDPMNSRQAILEAKAWKMAKDAGEPKLMTAKKMAEATGKLADEINTLRISFLLSGPGTQSVNAISNMIQYFKLPTQQMIGGALTGNVAMMRHAAMTLKGQVFASMDAIDATLRVLKKGDSELDVFNNKMDTSIDMSLNSSEYRKVVTLPMRFLMGMDEFFKQSTYRGRMLADADAIAKDMKLTGKDRDTFLRGYVADSFDDAGAGTRPNALEQARAATFTNELLPNSVAAQIQRWAQTMPSVRFIVPFVRTPTNILVEAVQHIPGLGALSKTFRADWAAGGVRKAQAVGKQAIGLAVITTAWTWAQSGTITGSGPKNPQARAIWMKNNRPYSVKVENEDGTIRWVSYARFEPLSNLLAITADFNEILQDDYNEFSEDDGNMMAGALILATAENSINKTFLQGIGDFIKLVSARDSYSQQAALRNMAGSFAPNFINQTDGDDYYRITRGMLDGFKAKAGIKEFDARRDLLGEPIVRALPKYDPMGALVKDTMTVDPVMAELQELSKLNGRALTQMSASVPSPLEPGGSINLQDIEVKPGQSVFDGLLEHLRTVEIGGKTLREALEAEIKKKSYLNMYQGQEGVSDSGTRIGVIKSIIGAYREKAKGTYKPYRDIVIEGKRQDVQKKREFYSGGNKTDIENKLDLIEGLQNGAGKRYKRNDPLL